MTDLTNSRNIYSWGFKSFSTTRAIQKLVSQTDNGAGTSTSEAHTSSKRKRDNSEDQDDEDSDKAGSEHSEDEKESAQQKEGRRIKKRPEKKAKIVASSDNESSYGEIKDDEEDAMSIEECSDDEYLKEIENDLNNKEKTVDKVAESMAENHQ